MGKRKAESTKKKPAKKAKPVEEKDEKNKEKDHDDEEDEADPVPLHKTLTEQMLSEKVAESNKATGKEKEKEVTYNKNAKSIADLGYKFQDRKLVDAETGGKFKFIDQTHYEILGDLIVTEIQNIMKTEFKMVEKFVPAEGGANIYHSPDFLTNKEVLMVLICGSGAVKAGQWARSLCINDTLDTGTIIPYLENAHSAGYSTIVFNPNFRNKELPTAETHSQYVWDNFVSKSPAKRIVIVAHSYGGCVTVNLLANRTDEILDRVAAIAFTDSVHSVPRDFPKKARTFLQKKGCNWVTSKLALDKPVSERDSQGCKAVSAGHNVHEYTSGFARTSVFEFVKTKLSS